MELKPFLLDMWLDTHEHGIEFNLAASTGPSWTLNEVLSLHDALTPFGQFINELVGIKDGDGVRTAWLH